MGAIPVAPPMSITDIRDKDYTFNIALGIDELLAPFSLYLHSKGIKAFPYNHLENGWALQSWDAEKVVITIKTLGFLPNTHFHFNLSSKKAKSLDFNVFANTVTTAEFLTVSSMFQHKTTFYKKKNTAGTVYQQIPLNEALLLKPR